MQELPVIYIVDDDVMIRKLLKHTILSAFNVRVADFDNGESALRKATENPPVLILLDLYMPNLSGKETLRMLRSMRETIDIPVVVCSAESQMEAIRDIVQYRIEGYLLKPFEAAAVVQKIAAATGIQPVNPIERKQKQAIPDDDEKAVSVMLIGHDPQTKALIAATLEKEFSGHIMEVPTLTEAPYLLEKFTPALIIVELQNEGKAIHDLTVLFKSIDRQLTSVVVCTDNISQETAAELVASGVAVIVLKPFTAKQFASKIRRFTTRKN